MQKYKLSLMLTEPMLGTVPYDPEIYSSFIESKKPSNIKDDESASVEKREIKGWTGFHKDDGGLFIFDYMIRGFLKHAGNVIKEELKIKALRNKISKFVFVFPRKIYLGIDKPDEIIFCGPHGPIDREAEERPLKCRTPQGERVSLARSDTVKEGRIFDCEIHVLAPGVISETTIRKILDYGQYQGLGQFRSGSFGRFDYELKKISREKAA